MASNTILLARLLRRLGDRDTVIKTLEFLQESTTEEIEALKTTIRGQPLTATLHALLETVGDPEVVGKVIRLVIDIDRGEYEGLIGSLGRMSPSGVNSCSLSSTSSSRRQGPTHSTTLGVSMVITMSRPVRRGGRSSQRSLSPKRRLFVPLPIDSPASV